MAEQTAGLLGDWNNQEKAVGGIFSAGSALRGFNYKATLLSIFTFFIPEIFQKRSTSAKRPGPTAWLDGLRGVAALSVCTMHLTVFTHPNLELCYGAPVTLEKSNTSIAAWPIFRLPFSGGHFAVILFFTISGYVVPRRMIGLLHEGRHADFLETLNGAVVRRAGRLFIPVFFSTLALLTFWHITGIVTAFPQRQPNWFLELWAWFKDQMKFTYYYRGGFLFTYYNAHTWTIPVELRGSMNLFVWLFAVHQCSTYWRILLTLGATLFLSVGNAGAWYAAFFAGMLTSELDLIATNGVDVSLPWDPIFRWFTKHKKIKAVAIHIVLYCGLWLASQPSSDTDKRDDVYKNCGSIWPILNKLMPDSYEDPGSTYRWFYLFWAAWLILISGQNIAWFRWVFETGPAQYLGKHSFSLYLVHGPMIAIWSDRLFYLTGVKTPFNDDDVVRFGHLQNRWKDASWWFLPDGGYYGLEPNFIFCVALSLPVMMWVAEIGTKAFDAPGIKISHWLWKKMKTLR